MTRTQWPEQVSLLISQRIRQIRQEAGMSQQTLGDAIDVSFQQIQKYETGANRISVNRLLQIARALNVDIRCLFDGVVTGSKLPQFANSSPSKRAPRKVSSRLSRLRAARLARSSSGKS